MTQILTIIISAWLAIGLFLVLNSGSRGALADILFLFTWPIYLYLDWRGKL